LARTADLRPRDFRLNSAAALKLAPRDRVHARVYRARARELVPPADMKGAAFWVARNELATAADHWLDGNLADVLKVAEGLDSRIDSMESAARGDAANELFPVFLELGQLSSAARVAQRIGDPVRRHELLSRVAFLRDDPAALREEL